MNKKIIHVLDIKASEDAIINAVSTLEGVRAWWNSEATGNANVGGIIEFRFADVFKPDIKIVQRTNSMVKWECVGGEKHWANSTFTFTLSKNGQFVRVTFIQEYGTEVSEEIYGHYNFNWGFYLHSLKSYCETGKGNPWVNKPNNSNF